MLKTQYILDFALKKFKNWTFIFKKIFNSRWATKIVMGLGNPKLETNLVYKCLPQAFSFLHITPKID